MPAVDVLIPTYRRPAALAATLASLLGQTHRDFAVVVSDQTADGDAWDAPEVLAAVRVLEHRGHRVELRKHLPRRGMAEHRDALLARATAPYALFLDDDVLCEPDVVERLVAAIEREGCGFVGSFVEAPSAVRSTKAVDEPPPHVRLELWDGPVGPEVVRPGTPQWRRKDVHFAANLHRLVERDGLDVSADHLYKVAWVGGCVLYDVAKLRAVGGFGFWRELPELHVGEDVAAQLAVMARFGGAGLLPSGAWHQEVPTTMPRAMRAQAVDAPYVLG